MKRVKLLLVALVCLFTCVLASCASYHFQFVNVSGIVYAMGTQTVTISTSDEAKFEEKLDVSYVTLSDQLKGKTIDSFTYVSETTAELTLSGTLESYTPSNSAEHYTIELSNNSLKGNTTATVTLTVYLCSPMISSGNTSFVSGKKASSTFTLDYGSFIESNCNTTKITLPDSNGTITTVKVVDNVLTIVVENYASTEQNKYPVVKLDASCTTFGVDISVNVGQMFFFGYIYK